MDGEVYLSDNSGNRVPPHPHIADPIEGSGQTVSAVNKDTNYSNVVVVGGAIYAITSLVGNHIFGIATTDTVDNILWVCAEGETIVIRIPEIYIALHYQTEDDSRKFYLRRLAE